MAHLVVAWMSLGAWVLGCCWTATDVGSDCQSPGARDEFMGRGGREFRRRAGSEKPRWSLVAFLFRCHDQNLPIPRAVDFQATSPMKHSIKRRRREAAFLVSSFARSSRVPCARSRGKRPPLASWRMVGGGWMRTPMAGCALVSVKRGGRPRDRGGAFDPVPKNTKEKRIDRSFVALSLVGKEKRDVMRSRDEEAKKQTRK